MPSADILAAVESINRLSSARNDPRGIDQTAPRPKPKPPTVEELLEGLTVDSALTHSSLSAAADDLNASAEVLRKRLDALRDADDFDVMTISVDDARVQGAKRREGMVVWLRDTATAYELQRDLWVDSLDAFGSDLQAAEKQLTDARSKVERGLNAAGFTRQTGTQPRPHLPPRAADRQIENFLRQSPLVQQAEKHVKALRHSADSCRTFAAQAEKQRGAVVDMLKDSLRREALITV